MSPGEGKNDQGVDVESADEILKARGEEAAAAAAAAEAKEAEEKAAAERAKVEARPRMEQARQQGRLERERRANPSGGEAMVRQDGKSHQRQVATTVARSLVRGLLGGLFRGRRSEADKSEVQLLMRDAN